ncbi:MAG: hypothetical protein Q4B43_00710 [Bacteroidota bacterium]|nr:hypothetical protein [Bacteroidota bacterium]
MKITERLNRLYKNIDNVIIALICLFILFSVFLSSFHTAYTSHISFYEKKSVPWVDKFFNYFVENPLYETVLEYTGLNTGYGFFSPNVSSDFVIIHQIYKDGKESIKESDYHFSTKEGAHRFRNLNNVYIEKLDEQQNKNDVDSLRMEYLGVIIKRLNSYSLERNSEVDSIRTTIFLYHYPLLEEYPDTNSKLIKIESYSKQRNI